MEYSVAQQRTIATALDLFGEHGVSGTSLPAIADALRQITVDRTGLESRV